MTVQGGRMRNPRRRTEMGEVAAAPFRRLGRFLDPRFYSIGFD